MITNKVLMIFHTKCGILLSLALALGACGDINIESGAKVNPGNQTIPGDSSDPLPPPPKELASGLDFESSTKKITGKALSPYHKSADTGEICLYNIHASHRVPQSFSKRNDYDLKLNQSGEFTFTSNINYLGFIKIPIEVTCSSGHVEYIQLNLKTQITGSQYNDPLAANQWHQHNTGQKNEARNGGTPGHDINIGILHLQGVTGDQIRVAVMDDGLEIGHEDLTGNISPGLSYDYVDRDNDPTPPSSRNSHGTKVSGIISAKANNMHGGHGVAPDTLLRGFNYLRSQTSMNIRDIYKNKLDNVLVVNKSFGYDYLNNRLRYYNSTLSLLEDLRRNNGGRGVVLVKSAGNSFNSGDVTPSQSVERHDSRDVESQNLPVINSGASDQNTYFDNMVVSAVNANAASPHSSYSSVGANVFIAAPGGEFGYTNPAILSTHVSGAGSSSLDSSKNYTHRMNGTSAAAPVLSGVAALICQVNNQLTWRDVRYIIAKTAKKIDINSADVVFTRGSSRFVAQNGWITNAAGYNFHNWYGFGMVNATKAVQMAANNYQLLPPLETTAWIAASPNANQNIPENFNGVEKVVDVRRSLTVEAIQIKISIDHERLSDLAIVVTSPNGTRSVIFTPRSLIGLGSSHKDRFDETILLSNAFYGESANGSWSIQVVDTHSGRFYFKEDGSVMSANNNVNLGVFKGVELRVYGH